MQQENQGQSISPWMAATAELNRSMLAEDTRADVCIGRAERLHCDRRLGNGYDTWHHRRRPPDRPDPRSGESLGHVLRPFPKDVAGPGPICRRESQRRQAIRRLADRRGCGFIGADRSRRGRGHSARADEDGRLPRCAGSPPRALGRLPASGRHRSLERRREDLGLPLPRLPLQPRRRSAERTREPRLGQCG